MNRPAPRWYLLGSPSRVWGAASFLLLGSYALVLLESARAQGLSFSAVEPWPLGADPRGAIVVRAVSLALGLGLGWAIPGLCLARLSDPGVRGAALFGRALGLGVGYILVTGFVQALVTGHAPGRVSLLVWLALPALVATLRSKPGSVEDADVNAGVLAALAAMLLVALALWPKLALEGMNGDGSEAYELARSLDAHRLPRWDLERPEGAGRFGTPAVNPFLTNSYLAAAEMALLGRGELAVRLPFVPALVMVTILAGGWGPGRGATAWTYAGGTAAVFLLWNAYYVGYEPAFTDLAEPAATDTLMTALWLAGFGEVVTGSPALGVGFLLLASGILYSAPLLATTALGALWLARDERGRRAFRLWLLAAGAALALALLAGLVQGDLPDWVRQVRSEYWFDLVDQRRRTPTLPLLGLLLMMTGGLPLGALTRLGRLSAPARALLIATGLYLVIVAASSYKNLHYLGPIPFLLAPAALEASGARLRAAAIAVLAGTLVASWPSPRGIHRETVDLGRMSCLAGLGYEDAALGGDVIYTAFHPPGDPSRFGVGKHTFARYAQALGGPGCAFRLSRTERPGWIPVAGDAVALSVRDVELYVAWRFRQPPIPSSWLFPRSKADPLPIDPAGWRGRRKVVDGAGSALLLEGFVRVESTDPGNPPVSVETRAPTSRLLVPAPAARRVRLRVWGRSAVTARTRVNGVGTDDLSVPAGWSEVVLSAAAPPWRSGWNVLEISSPPPLALDWIEAEGP